MSTKNYQQIANTLRLGTREIARRAGVSATTVMRILAHQGEPFYSAETATRVRAVIDAEMATMQKNLKRLMGPAAD